MGKPRKLPYQIITPEEVILAGQPYELLAEIRAEHHFDCAEARIALAWRKGLKPNVDGHLLLGKCVKLSDLQREMVPYDYVIVLNKEVWEDPEFGREKKLALLDHEMSHTAPALDAEGEKVRDTKGRLCWRIRGHDIEEFEEIVARHGCYKRDLQRFAEALRKRREAQEKEPLLASLEQAPGALANDSEFLNAADRLASSVRSGEVTSMTISSPGMEPVVIDKAAAERIHARAVGKGKKS